MKSSKFSILIIILLALLSRTYMFYKMPEPADGREIDGKDYFFMAQSFLKHGTFLYPDTKKYTSTRPPMFPLFLSFLIKLTYNNKIAIRIILLSISVLLCIFVFYIGKTYVSHICGFIAGLLLAIHKKVINFSYLFMSETFAMAIVLLMIYFIIKFITTNKKMFLLYAAVFTGIFILTKPYAIFLPLFLSLFFWVFHKMSKKKIILFLLLSYITVLPWSIRNYIRFKKLIPVTTGGGGALFIGNFLPTDGIGHIQFNGKTGYDYMRKYFKGIKLWRASPEAYKKMFKKAVDNILKNPLKILWLDFKKFFRFFGVSPYFYKTKLKKILGIIFSLIIFITCIYGIFISFLRKNKVCILSSIIVLYSAIIHALIFAKPRFAIPIMPLILLLTGYAFQNLYPMFSNKIKLSSKTIT